MVLKLTLRCLVRMGYQCTFGVLQVSHIPGRGLYLGCWCYLSRCQIVQAKLGFILSQNQWSGECF